VHPMSIPLAHHDGSPLYVSNPCPGLGQNVDLLVRTSEGSGTRAVHLRATPDGEPTFVEARVDRRGDDETWWRVTLPIVNAEMSYRFLLDTPDGGRWLNGLGVHARAVTDAADYRLTTHSAPPAWTDEAIVYQIFPDRFARSNAHPVSECPDWAVSSEWDDPVAWGTPDGVRQNYGGTLWGIAENLGHLERLGANTIYLTPFFPARSNHRYDATDFEHVDPLLGGDSALSELISQAKRRGIRIIGDITLNHTGNEHPWFRRGQRDPDSPEAGFYYFEDDRNNYATFAGVSTLPKLDHRSAELRRRLYDGQDSVIARYLTDDGIDGWRVDVAQSAGRYRDTDLSAEVATLTRATMTATGRDAFLVAEHQHDASASLRGDGWHATMAYSGFTRPIWSWLTRVPVEQYWGVPTALPRYSGHDMKAVMAEFAAAIPWQSFSHNLTLLDSHDTPRFRSVAGREMHHLGAAMLMTLPGLPTIFAGDEIGLEGVHPEDSRRPIPTDTDAWDHGTLDLYRNLISLRRAHPALRSGGLRWMYCDEDVVIYERALDHQALVIQVSRDTHEPVIADARAVNLTGGPDLIPGQPMPGDGPAFHIWLVSS